MKTMIFALTFLIAGTAAASVNSVKVCESDDSTLSIQYTVKDRKMTLVAEKFGQKFESVVAEDIPEISELSSEDLRNIAKDFKIKETLVEATMYAYPGYSAFVFAVDSSGEHYVMNSQEHNYSSSKYCQ